MICAVAALLSACSGSGSSPVRLGSPKALLDWLVTHRDHVGLAVLPDGKAAPTLTVNARQLFPLASTKKVLILAAYAMAVAADHLGEQERVPLTELARYYWPGTDGGAHTAAVRDWQQRGLVSSDEIPLSAVAEAMIRWSDNASADYLLMRVGGPQAVATMARRLGMTAQQPVAPILGELRCWSTRPKQWLASTPKERVAMAESAAAAGGTTTLPSVPEQRRLAETDAAGTPAEWVRAMSQLASGDQLPLQATDIVQRVLNWPLSAFPQNRKAFDAYLTKGGSLPGVITEISYIRSRGAPVGVTVALFLRDLPADVEASLRNSFEQQAFIRALATDPNFRHAAEQDVMSD